jgi:predicted chitinase
LAATLANAMGNALSLDEYRRLLPGFLEGLRQAECTNELRVAQYIAQTGHESGGLRYRREIDEGWYLEGRTDLGNDQPGDGPKYRGAGYLQVTGKANFSKVSQWAHAKGLVPSPTWFVDNPEDLASEQWAAVSAAWYWTVERPGLNALCDATDHEGVCRAINGGLNGFDDRVNRYTNALPLAPQFLPAVLDSGDDFMAALNDDEQRELLDLLRRVAALLGARR